MNIFSFTFSVIMLPILLFAQDATGGRQPTRPSQLCSVPKVIDFKVSEAFFVPAIDFDAYLGALCEQNEYIPGHRHFSISSLEELERLRAKGQQECYALHSVLDAYVKGELEGEYDINAVVKCALNSGIGIEYTPERPLQIICILSSDKKLVLPLAEEVVE